MTTLFPERHTAAARRVVALLQEAGLKVTTVESCTGGLIAALLTEIPGSSAVFDFGFVTYANVAKTRLVGVRAETLKAHGAVSEETAREMAEGALAAASCDLAVSCTGIAGPGGGTAEKPVGLVYLAIAIRGGETRILKRSYGDIGRAQVRMETVADALGLIEEAAGQPRGP